MERNPDVTDPEPIPENGAATAENGPVCSCGAARSSKDENRCARGHLIAGNQTARKFPDVRKEDIAKQLEGLLAHYQPQTPVLRETCEHVARAYAEMKTIDAGSLEWHRILNITQELTATLDASLSTRIEQLDDLANQSDDDLIEQATAILRGLLDARDHRPAADHRAQVAGLPSEASAEPAGEAVAPTPALAPETCPYCHQTPCVGKEHRAYDVLHWNDPEIVAKRDKEATAVMLKQIGRPLPEWYR